MRSSFRHCQHEWQKAWSDGGHRGSLVEQRSTLLSRTELFTIDPATLVNGARVRRPASGGVTVPNGLNYNTLQVVINLPAATKLLVGATLDLEVYFSFDGGTTWQFISGYLSPNVWHSYGPNGLTVIDPDGTVHVNPDPTVYVPLNGVTGQLVHIEYVAQALTTAGATVYGVS